MNFRDQLKVEGINARGYGILPKMVMLDRKLTIEAKAIYSYFCSYAGAGTTAFPSRDKICDDLCIGKTRYYNHFDLLKKYGYIKVEQVRNEKGLFKHNIYTLVTNPKPVVVENDVVENLKKDSKSKVIKPSPHFKDMDETKQNQHTYPSPHFEDTDGRHADNEDINSNNSFFNSNTFLYKESVSQSKQENQDRQTELEKEKDFIIKQTQAYLYKGEYGNLLENSIRNLLQLKTIKVNNMLLNANQIRDYLNRLNINIYDFALLKFRQLQDEKVIKNKARYFEVLLLNSVDEYSVNNVFN